MNRFIMTSSQRCLGCHTCEIACVMAHNDEQHVLSQHHFHPRIAAIKHQQQRSAVTCHHCEDAPCARSCPNGAISRVDDSTQVNQRKYIGCKSCAVACPFGTIQIVLTPVATGKVEATVYKCDLCAGYENGPACVENRLADALQLVTDVAFSGTAKSHRLHTARQEHRPWHASTVAQEMPVMSKIGQMQATPACDEPDKLAIETRKTGLDEAYLPFRADQARREASYCLKCGEHSVREQTCPLYNHTPQWIEPVEARDIDATIELFHQTGTLLGITRRVCPQNRLCEGACTIRDEHDTVTIGNIEHYISDQALTKGWRSDLSHVTRVDRRVTVIGAGPAGLTCADALTRDGMAVTVYGRHLEISGLLIFGIPSFGLGKSLLARRREIFSAVRIHFELNCEVGKNVSLDPLLEQYDAIFVGVGAYRSMEAGLPNEGAPDVCDALPFLIANTKQVMGLGELPGEPFINATGLNVVVLGGSGTAMDCVHATLRHGASNVTCAYRRDEASMPGSRKEVRNTRGEEANFELNVQLVALGLNEQGHVCEIRFLRTRLDEPDAQGRRRPVPIEGSEFIMPADAVIVAFSFNPHGMPWLESHGVTVDKWGRIIADVKNQYRYQTTNPKIFAGGDVVHGMDLMVTVMTEGRHAAQGIIDWLEIKSIKSH